MSWGRRASWKISRARGWWPSPKSRKKSAWPSERIADGFLPYGLLLTWGEAFLSGLLTAIFTVYEPRWMATFDDERYLRPPPRG